jgi:hypothetical protein
MTAISVAVIGAPQWVSSVWSLFSSEPLVPWLSARGIPHFAFSAWSVTIPIGVAMFGIVLWAEFVREKPAKNSSRVQAPQPVIVALDELKALLYEGQRLVGIFQEDPVKPTFAEVDNWRKRTRDCARQNTLSSVVTARDLLALERPWDEGKVLRATANFLDYGCFADGSTEMAVFQHLWGSVQRLEQLMTKIESEAASVKRENAGSPDSWSITYEQETAMLEILENSPKAPVMVMSTKGDRVGNAYAMRLVQVLRKAGIEIGQCVFDESWRLPIGVNLWASDTADIL